MWRSRNAISAYVIYMYVPRRNTYTATGREKHVQLETATYGSRAAPSARAY